MELSKMILGLTVMTCLMINVIQCQELTLRMSTDLPMSIGDDVTVQCRVDDFPPGAALLWWKRQGKEEVKVGENNVLDVDVSRYELQVNQAKTSMIFYLNIRGIQPEDNGDFGCSLSTDEDLKLYKNLVVSDPVHTIQMFAMPSANVSEEPIKEFQNGESFYFHDGQDYFFQCVASGSNPIPSLDVTIGYRDGVEVLNDKFVREDILTSDPSSGEYGFRKTNYEAVMTTTVPIVVGWKANSQELMCSASVPNMAAPKTIHIKPILKIPPIIECESERKVPIYSGNVEVSCNVFADPPLQDIRWYWGNSHKAVCLLPGEIHGYWSYVLKDGDKPDMKVATLKFERTFVEMYRKYNLVAKNTKGIAHHTFSLRRDPRNEN